MQAHLLPSLEARNISVRYHDNGPLQLDGVSLTLSPGELVGVIGPNGSGKSTLVRALSRTLRPCDGNIYLDHADLYISVTQRESARLIAVVPQSTDVFLDFTVRDIVAMGRAPLRANSSVWPTESIEDRNAVDSALAKMDIPENLASRSVADVSGGERQRALIARMLAQEARFLLLDEPTAALDIKNESILLTWLRKLASDENRGVLVVLHDLNLACELADRLVVLSDGKVAGTGTPKAVMTSDLIQHVYGIQSWVRSNPATGKPTVLPLPNRNESADSVDVAPTVHLFCGGGTGSQLMFELVNNGVNLTISLLHIGDSDEEVAQILNLPYPQCRPFSFPSDDALKLARQIARNASIAILTSVPIGDINRAVLDGAKEFVDSGRQMIIFDPVYATKSSKLSSEFDRYTNVVFVSTIDEVLKIVSKGTEEHKPQLDETSLLETVESGQGIN